MNLLYAISWLCDAMLYFGALGCLGLLSGCPPWLFAAPLVMAVGCGVGFRFLDRGRWWLLPPALAIAAAMLLAGRPLARVLCAPPAVYLIMYMQANRAVADYYYAADRFRRALLVLLVVALVAVMAQIRRWTQGLPYLFCHLSMSVFLLRMLRADDTAVRSRRFRMMNLTRICGVCALGFALSQPAVISALGAAWRFLSRRVLGPLISGLLYVISWVLYGVAWLLSRLFPKEPDIILPPSFQSVTVEQAFMPPSQGRAEINPIARALVIALLAALAVAVVLLILRALARQMARPEGDGVDEVREALPEPELPPRMRRPRRGDTVGGVRYHYLRQLRAIAASGGVVTPAMNTRQVRDQNAGAFDADAMDELREIYLPVRYGGREATPGDVRRAKEACERVRRRDGKGGGADVRQIQVR